MSKYTMLLPIQKDYLNHIFIKYPVHLLFLIVIQSATMSLDGLLDILVLRLLDQNKVVIGQFRQTDVSLLGGCFSDLGDDYEVGHVEG